MDFGRISRHAQPILLDEWNQLVDSYDFLQPIPDRKGTNPFTNEEVVFSGEGKAYYVENGEKVGNIALEDGELGSDIGTHSREYRPTPGWRRVNTANDLRAVYESRRCPSDRRSLPGRLHTGLYSHLHRRVPDRIGAFEEAYRSDFFPIMASFRDPFVPFLEDMSGDYVTVCQNSLTGREEIHNFDHEEADSPLLTHRDTLDFVKTHIEMFSRGVYSNDDGELVSDDQAEMAIAEEMNPGVLYWSRDWWQSR